jgi:hypothetical protein
MASILRLVERKTAFDPEEVDILVAAFDEAWSQLCASGQRLRAPRLRPRDASSRGTTGR